MAYELVALPYDYNALEPTIDELTMHLHHDRHHQAYVNNLNAAVEKHPELFSKTPEDLISNLNAVPDDIRTAVRNNAGGTVNHTMFWFIMKPNGGGAPTGAIADVISANFKDADTFKQQFGAAGGARFGSGWVWLSMDKGGAFRIESTPNQDSPLMEGRYPIFGNDVWEHAYYLKYYNQRPNYLNAWWSVVNWDEINRRIEHARNVWAKQ
jgi:Fe-Mn family superoxide dismutase